MIDSGTAVTFGAFDGLHKGHLALIDEVLKYRSEGLKTVCVSLRFKYGPDQKALLTEAEETEILERYGIDYHVRIPVSPEFFALSREAFVQDFLIGKLHTKVFAAGRDFTFGRERLGNIAWLSEKAESFGFRLSVIPEYRIGGERLSSTRIRSFLDSGNVSAAAADMGRPYTIGGEAVHGRALAGKLGFPTLNIVPPPEKYLPRYGVYYVQATIDGKVYDGMANLGVKPTVTDENTVLLEVHLIGQSGDYYGKNIITAFMAFIRPERHFSSLDELKKAVRDDLSNIECLIKGESVMLKKIREILSEQLNIDPEDVTEDASFREDLGVDSLDLFELVMNLEEEYGFEIPGEDLQNLETVGDVIDYLKDNGIDA